MEHKAICPSCRKRFSRWYFFRTIPELGHKCPSCGAVFKSNSLWEWLGNFILVGSTAVPIMLAMGGILQWSLALAVVGVLFALAIFVFPYVTKYDLITDKRDGEVEQPAAVDADKPSC